MSTVIKIAGRQGSGKGVSANDIYKDHVRAGKHVVIFDEGLVSKNSRPKSDPKTADVTIVCEYAPTPLNITTL